MLTFHPTFVFCLIFGICGNVGNQTKLAAAAEAEVGENTSRIWGGKEIYGGREGQAGGT